MSEDHKIVKDNIQYSQLIRSREDIQGDLLQIVDETHDFDLQAELVTKRLMDLPEKDSDILKELSTKMDSEEMGMDELPNQVPAELLPLALDMKRIMDEWKGLTQREEELYKEYTPYKKKDFEEKLSQISDRISFDRILSYYEELRNGKIKGIEGADSLTNTVNELFIIRRYQYEFITQKENKDYHYYSQGEYFLSEWMEKAENRGFLKEAETGKSKVEVAFSVDLPEKRIGILKDTSKALAELELYGKYFSVYRSGDYNDRGHQDFFLEDINSILANQWKFGGDKILNYSDPHGLFDYIGYDPKFILAVEKQVRKIIDKHQRSGRIHRTTKFIDEDRARIDAISIDTVFENLKVEGFDKPSEMVAIITPNEILSLAQIILPPDFMRDLRKLSHKDKSQREKDGDHDTETVGSFFPILRDEGEKWDEIVATEIEIYRDLFVPKDTSPIDRAYVKSEFLETVWHEFGHNAHNTLDFDEMSGWENVMREDSVAITWYVKHSRKKDPEGKGKIEDFATSFSMFITNPALLIVLSPLRYQYMREYFDRHLLTTQKKAFEDRLRNDITSTSVSWEFSGYSKEDIRNIYLHHEK